MEGSKKYNLNNLDFQKIGTGLLIALGGAFITWLPEQIELIDWGGLQPLAFAISSMAVNVIRKWIKDDSNKLQIPKV